MLHHKYMRPFKLIFFVIIFTLSACTTKKNTSVTRAYHNLTARFNVYFNGNESLKSGLQKIDKTYKDDFSNIIPIFKYNDLSAAIMLTPEMDRTIQKSAKLIKSHSITVKPKVDKKKDVSKKDRDFLNKAEYCNWIADGYLIMGQAHYLKREFITAEQTFLLIINKYKKDIAKYKAKFWLAKTKIETEDFEDAFALLKELKKSSKKPKSMSHEINLVYADMYIKHKDYKNGIKYLKKSIEAEKNKNFKTRLIYIIAQLYNKQENYKKAVVNFQKVIKRNPEYDMAFSAKIKLAEIYEKTKSDAKGLKKDLLKMLKDDKNIDYFDQIYYALGRIELNDKNIPQAMEYFRLSANSQSSSKNQKVKTFIVLAEYYRKNEKYQLSGPYYDSTVQVMDKSFPDYDAIYPKMKSYASLMQHLNMVSTQDSLQFVAKLPEKERNKLIAKQIKQIVDAEQDAANANNSNTGDFDPFMDNNNVNKNELKGGGWYFYSPQAVSYGQTNFKKKWGDRKLEDLWRLNNKRLLVNTDIEEEENNENAEKAENKTEKISNKTREYYLQDLPLTDEKIAESNKNIQNALLSAGLVYADELDEKEKAIIILELLLKRFPNTEKRLDALQLIYNTSKRNADNVRTEKYKNLIIDEFPNSINAKILTDPNFIADQKRKKQDIEDLYNMCYSFFSKQKYLQTINLCNQGLKDYPDNSLNVNFQYLKALSYGESGNKNKLKEELEFLVLKYPKSEIASNAKEILQLMETGRYNEKLYVLETESEHYYVILIPNKKVDFNKLKFSYQSFNVDNYNEKNLNTLRVDLDINHTMVVVMQFKNSGDAQLYYLEVLNKKVLTEFSNVPYQHFIISKANYLKFQKDMNTEKYMKFFKESYGM